MGLLNFDPNSERIALAHRRLKSAYNREAGAEVPIVEPNVCVDLLTTKETVEDLDKMLDKAASWANNLAATNNDWTPGILGYCAVVMVPEAFGCEVVFLPGQSPWARHAVTDILQVWDLKPQPVGTSPMIKRHFEWLDYAQRKLGTDIPMWTLDIQSPFSVAAQIVEPEELMMACITDPKTVHHLCRMVTEYLIEFMHTLLSRIEHPGFPGANFPCISDDIGLCLADDTPLIMLGPQMYREFALPYNCQLGEEFGGIHLHSCGNYQHNLDNALDITNIRSMHLHTGPGEFGLPESPDEDCPFNRARKRLTCFFDANDVSRCDEYRGKHREYYSRYLLPRLCAGDLTGCILQGCGCVPEADLDDCKAAVAWTRRELARQIKKST